MASAHRHIPHIGLPPIPPFNIPPPRIPIISELAEAIAHASKEAAQRGLQLAQQAQAAFAPDIENLKSAVPQAAAIIDEVQNQARSIINEIEGAAQSQQRALDELANNPLRHVHQIEGNLKHFRSEVEQISSGIESALKNKDQIINFIAERLQQQ